MLESKQVTSMSTTPDTGRQEELGKRQEDYRQAMATLRLEALAPGAQARRIFQQYVEGELTLEKMGLEIDKLHERQFGPVRLPGD